jgi:hypothetical protein
MLHAGRIKMKTVCIALFWSWIFFGAVAAHSETAEEMASICRDAVKMKVVGSSASVPSTFNGGECWGAFVSFIRATHYYDPDTSKPVFGICYPNNVTVSQSIKIFVAYSKRHPEQDNKDFFQVAIDANKEAFPCSK